MSTMLIIVLVLFALVSFWGIKYFNETKVARVVFGIVFFSLLIVVILLLANMLLPKGLAGLFTKANDLKEGKVNVETDIDEPSKKSNTNKYDDPTKSGTELGNNYLKIYVEGSNIIVDGEKYDTLDDFREKIKYTDFNNKKVYIGDIYANSKTMNDVLSILEEYYSNDNNQCYDEMEQL